MHSRKNSWRSRHFPVAFEKGLGHIAPVAATRATPLVHRLPPGLGLMSGCSSGVEHNLAKVGVGRSNRLTRSKFFGQFSRFMSPSGVFRFARPCRAAAFVHAFRAPERALPASLRAVSMQTGAAGPKAEAILRAPFSPPVCRIAFADIHPQRLPIALYYPTTAGFAQHAMKPSVMTSLGRLRPMKTRRETRSSPSFQGRWWSPSTSMWTPWTT